MKKDKKRKKSKKRKKKLKISKKGFVKDYSDELINWMTADWEV